MLQWKHITIIVLTFILGAALGYTLHRTFQTQERGFIVREGEYKFISPILACEIAQAGSFSELHSVESALERVIDKKIADREVGHLSVYLRLLNSGRWVGINEDEEYTPASLMKVLLMMAFLKEAELKPSALTQVLQFTDAKEPGQYGPDGRRVPPLEVGSFYTVSNLIERMAVYSSNAAEHTLLDNVNLPILEEVFSDLGLPPPDSQSDNGFYAMSPAKYSLALRVLYGASYLNREMSEAALALLSSGAYEDGIRKGVSEDMTVANKYGIFFEKETGPFELHDCGIVYYPDHPYLLCVMTKGTNLSALSSAIADIATTAYTELDQFYQNE
ncbi:MAG: serine hydrolase [Parcubacteria group bacterium]|nr:serine hydrolase [Parcubacteria group bacterium]